MFGKDKKEKDTAKESECHCHEHHHHHDDDGECHCPECEAKRNGEPTSIAQAGGASAGLTGIIEGFNADVEARFDKVMIRTGEYVQHEAGCLLGHIKVAIYQEDGKGITLNLTDLDNGVEHHGTLDPCESAKYNFMAAVLDVDSHELEHHMMHFLEDSGIDCNIDQPHHHHHDHGEECHCAECEAEREHEHHHHHEDGEECHCHNHEHEHHHHHDDDGECHCAECEAKRKEETEPKKSFLDKFKKKKE
ncbi:MAG: hydrogenase nickel incorporation protein HypA [Candidatus Methanomethylophilaceae archaeon]